MTNTVRLGQQIGSNPSAVALAREPCLYFLEEPTEISDRYSGTNSNKRTNRSPVQVRSGRTRRVAQLDREIGNNSVPGLR